MRRLRSFLAVSGESCPASSAAFLRSLSTTPFVSQKKEGGWGKGLSSHTTENDSSNWTSNQQHRDGYAQGQRRQQHRNANQAMRNNSREHQQHSRKDIHNGGGAAPQSLEEKLQRRFGLHAKIVVRPVQHLSPAAASAAPSLPSTSSNSDSDGHNSAPPSSSAQFKASVTFKQLGFPVEIAVAQEADANAATLKAFDAAMSTNVLFISPQLPTSGPNAASAQLLDLKHAVEELRGFCQTLGRVLKFSVKPRHFGPVTSPSAADVGSPAADASGTPPASASASPASLQFQCRAYVKDDWAITSNLNFLCETRSFTANDALCKCFMTIRDTFKAELASDSYVRDEFLEAERYLLLKGKKVEVNVLQALAAEKALEGDTEAIEDVEEQQSDESSLHRDAAQEQQRGGINASLLEASGGSSARHALQAQADSNLRQHYQNTSKRSDPSSSSSHAGKGYSISAIVTDRNDNTYTLQSLNQATLVDAFRSIAAQIFAAEAQWDSTLVERASIVPMMVKMRYQIEGMAHYIRDMQHLDRGVELDKEDFARWEFEEQTPLRAQALVSAAGDDSSIVSTKAYKYAAKGFVEGKQVAESSGLGSYRVEYNVYVQLLSALLDQYPEVAQFHFAHCYPTIEALERAAYHHDHYRLYNHKGSWVCYSVLRSITSTLLGQSYDKEFVEYESASSASVRVQCRVLINDGNSSSRVLARKFAPTRGQSFRAATMEAIRNNFPVQYDIACQHAEFDSENDSQRGSRLRALPREKRVAHVNQAYGIIGLFAEEDYGWTALRIRTRTVAGDANRWVADLEALVQGETNRRIVAVSPITTSSKVARRLLVYNVCKQFFPKDLEAYAKLGRGDARNPEASGEEPGVVKVFRPGTPFFAQVLALLDRMQPQLAPFTWRVVRMQRPQQPSVEDQNADGETTSADDDDDGTQESLMRPLYLRFKATVFGNSGDVVVAERLGNEGEGALAVVRSVLRAVTTSYCGEHGYHNDGDVLWREFESSPPPALTSTQDLCQLLFHLSIGGSGGGDGTGKEALQLTNAAAAEQQQDSLAVKKWGENLRPTVSVAGTSTCSSSSNAAPAIDIEFVRLFSDWWIATMVMPNMGGVALARVAAKSKRDAHRGVWIAAARDNFARQLRHYSKHFIEAQAFADEVFHEVVAFVPAVLPPLSLKLSSSGATATSAAVCRTPIQLLRALTRRDFGVSGGFVFIEQTPSQNGGVGFTCRLYRQDAESHNSKTAVPSSSTLRVKAPHAVELGYATGVTKQQALHLAALAALEALYEKDLQAAVSQNPSFTQLEC